MNTGFEEAVLVITGAASGIGRATAEHAVRAKAGRLVLSDVDEVGLAQVAETLGPDVQIECVVGDLFDPETPERIIAHAVKAFGRVDGLVNAAGITTRCSMTDGTLDLWDRLFAINARAPFFLMQAAINAMLAQGDGGSIVNIQSINAHCGAPKLAIYSATKGALQTLTKNAAHAHIGDGIRVNGINLGWTVTEAEDRLQKDLLGSDDWVAEVGKTLPMGRLLVADDAARLVVYLLGAASAPLTGASIDLEQQPLGAPM